MFISMSGCCCYVDKKTVICYLYTKKPIKANNVSRKKEAQKITTFSPPASISPQMAQNFDSFDK
jgi:hypothetical protein